MLKKIFFTILLSVTCLFLFAQADCVITFRYKGSIINNGLKNSTIGLPKTRFLVGYIQKDDDLAFSEYIPKDSLIDHTLSSHMSSSFCGDADSVIKYIFKKKKEGYIVKVYTESPGSKKTSVIEVLVPLDAIKFTTEVINNREQIVVDLGAIKI